MESKATKGKLSLLKKYLETEKCEKCECLHGAFAILYTECEDKELKKEIKQLISKNLHSCLGCEPCPPADIIVDIDIK